MKICMIFNPYAAHGRAVKLLPEIENYCRSKQIECEIFQTEYRGHGIELVKNLDFNQYDAVVAGGGDGTLFEVINGYYRNPSLQRIPLGILPVGTGNAFARDLHVATNQWQEALEIISLRQPRRVDVGKFITHGETYYYLNILGLGFVSDVTAVAHKLKGFGNFSYTIGVFQQMLFLHTFGTNLEIDGQILDRDCVFVEISNTRYTSNFLMAPAAEIDDGRLDVTILNGLSRLKLIKAFPTIFTGEHVHLPQVETLQARQIKIATVEPKILTPDGEVLGMTPVEVECLYQDVEVLWR